MTNGTQTTNNQVTVYTTDLGSSSLIGVRQFKTWAGADQPRRAYTTAIIQSPTRYVEETIFYNRRSGFSFRFQHGDKTAREVRYKNGRWIRKPQDPKWPDPNGVTRKGLAFDSDFTEKIVIKAIRGSRVRKRMYSSTVRSPNAYLVLWNRQDYTFMEYMSGTVAKSYHSTNSPNVPALPALTSLIDSNTMNRAVSSMGTKVNGNQSFNPAIFVAELGQTLGLLCDTSARLAHSIAEFRLGRYAAAVNALRGFSTDHPTSTLSQQVAKQHRNIATTARNVLEVQYGWRPLIQDLFEGFQWLKAKTNAPKTFRFVSRASRRQTFVPYSGRIGIDFALAQLIGRVQITAYLTEMPTPGAFDFNLATPAQVLWEKLPWSFVIDWALPIGGYLEARGAASVMSGKFVTSLYMTRELTGGIKSPSGSEAYTKTTSISFSAANARWSDGRMERQISSSLSGNASFPNFKGLGATLSWQHCLNGVALLLASGGVDPRRTIAAAGRFKAGSYDYAKAFPRWNL